MNLEQLTKHQTILLAILVSFVSSVTTGIVTVSLMDQASPSVTHTINQIVERTVQTVTQPAAAVTAATMPPPTTTTKTVVMSDDDVAAQSIAAAQKSIVHIVAKGGDELIARGVILDSKGSAVTDAGALAASGATDFEAILADGERVPVTIASGQSSTSPLLAISVAVGTSTGFAPATVLSSSKLQLGQSIIRIGGTGTDIVGEGVVAELPASGGDTVETSVSSSVPGSLIMTLFGEVIGLSTTASESDDSAAYTLLEPPAASTASSTATNSSS